MINDIPESLSFEYEFLNKIGEGANGETWLVKNRIDKTRAAIKCLKLNTIEDLKAVELFEREVELLQSIHVFGVPRFYQYIHDEASNRSYLVQEYIPAPSIQSMLDNNIIFSEDETLFVAQKLAQIIFQLQTFYSPPIIHRDIKPSNILYDRKLRSVYLIDFGSVAHPEKRSGGSTVAGSLGYMPPEQLIGDVDIQSDYYALGATMLHMLTGVFPGTISSNIYQLEFDAVLNEKAPKTCRPMRALLSSLLSADIDKRPQTAEALLQELYEVQELKNANWFKQLLRQLFKHLFGKQNTPVSHVLPQSPATSPVHRQTQNEPNPLQAQNIQTNPDAASPQDSVPLKLSQYVLTIQDLEQRNNRKTRCKFLMRKWQKCPGIIRAFQTGTIDKHYTCMIEYTFDANNQTWLGVCRIPTDTFHNGHVDFPVNCCVIYNPKAPQANAIYSIDD